MNAVEQEIKRLKDAHLDWLGKTYSACSQQELRLVLDNLESELSPDCLFDAHHQSGCPPEVRRQAIRQLWTQIEADHGVSKTLSHKW